jgi:hypothetical protein
MSKSSEACQNIINAIESNVAGRHTHWQIITNNIMDAAQQLVTEGGYAMDVALAIACKKYPVTQYCGNYGYKVID